MGKKTCHSSTWMMRLLTGCGGGGGGGGDGTDRVLTGSCLIASPV